MTPRPVVLLMFGGFCVAVAVLIWRGVIPSLVEVVQLLVILGTMASALVSAIVMIRERMRMSSENERLRMHVLELQTLFGKGSQRRLDAETSGQAAGMAEMRELSQMLERSERLLREGGTIRQAPAARVVGWLRFLFSKHAFEAIFSQTILDGREEYFEALATGQKRLARWRLVQLYLALAAAAVSWTAVSTASKMVQLWRLGR